MKTCKTTRTIVQAAQEIAHIADFLGCDPKEIGEAKESIIIHSKLGVKTEHGEIYIYRNRGEKKTSQRTLTKRRTVGMCKLK